MPSEGDVHLHLRGADPRRPTLFPHMHMLPLLLQGQEVCLSTAQTLFFFFINLFLEYFTKDLIYCFFQGHAPPACAYHELKNLENN